MVRYSVNIDKCNDRCEYSQKKSNKLCCELCKILQYPIFVLDHTFMVVKRTLFSTLTLRKKYVPEQNAL